MAFVIPVIGDSKSKETMEKGEIDLHVNIEDDLSVHVNTKRRLITEQNLDLLVKGMEAIVTNKTKEQNLKASPFLIYVEEKLNDLNKHGRAIAENRIYDLSLGDWCEILEYWHSFREVKCHQGCSKTLWRGI